MHRDHFLLSGILFATIAGISAGMVFLFKPDSSFPQALFIGIAVFFGIIAINAQINACVIDLYDEFKNKISIHESKNDSPTRG